MRVVIGLIVASVAVSVASAWEVITPQARKTLFVAECPSVEQAKKAAEAVHATLRSPGELGIKVWGAEKYALDAQFRFRGELALRTTAATVLMQTGLPQPYERHLVAVEINEAAWLQFFNAIQSDRKPKLDI